MNDIKLISDNPKLNNLRLLLIEELLIKIGKEHLIPAIIKEADKLLIRANENNG